MNIPYISIIMPVYNEERYLKRAIESILNQSFSNFEFIIINDGSTDRSDSIIQSYKDPRIIYISRVNKGLVKSLNEGINRSQGEYIARMDADDISDLKRLQKSVDFLDQNLEIGLVGSSYRVIDKQGKIIGTVTTFVKDADIKRELFVGCPFGHGTIVIRKGVLDDVGLYRDNCGPVEDYELWVRVAKKYKMANLPEILYSWRFNTQGISYTKSQEQEKWTKKIINKVWNKFEFPDLSLLQIIRKITYYQNLNSPLNKKLAIKLKNQQYTLSILLIKNVFYFKGIKNLIIAFIIYPFGISRLIKGKLLNIFSKNKRYEFT